MNNIMSVAGMQPKRPAVGMEASQVADVRVPAVVEAVNRLEHAVDYLEERARLLDQRLTTVLSPEPTNEKAADEKPLPNNLAAHLFGYCLVIERTSQRLDSLISRLEI